MFERWGGETMLEFQEDGPSIDLSTDNCFAKKKSTHKGIIIFYDFFFVQYNRYIKFNFFFQVLLLLFLQLGHWRELTNKIPPDTARSVVLDCAYATRKKAILNISNVYIRLNFVGKSV